MTRLAGRIGGALIVVLAVSGSLAARERLALRHVTLDLPGPPSKVVPADLDGDGRMDLVVVVAYTEVEEIGEDRMEGLVQMTTVIPAAFDRREIHAYLATAAGGYTPAEAPLEMPPTVLHLEPGPASVGLIALTDDGLSRIRYSAAGTGSPLSFEPILEAEPFLAGTRSFFTNLELVHDLNGDGTLDLMLPAREGLAIYLGTPTGLSPQPSHVVELAGMTRSGRLERRHPMPEVRDVDGDGIADFLFRSGFRGGNPFGGVHVLLGSTEGVFRSMRQDPVDCHDVRTDFRGVVEQPDDYPWPENLIAVRNLDGVGRAEAVIAIERLRGDSWRKEMKDAKRPIHDFRFHRLDETLLMVAEPYMTMEVVGHSGDFGDDEEFPVDIRQFVDLDGDGRDDLVTITLDFSMWQALKILATKKIGIGLDFHVYAQQQDGSFVLVEGLDLSEKLKLDLNNLEIGRMGQFSGDFDGDGRIDFVHFGRGRTITIHAGQAGCRYPKKPDLSIELDEEPGSLELIRVEDLDGDGRADIRVTRPLDSDDPDTTAPVRLDLYVSGSAG